MSGYRLVFWEPCLTPHKHDLFTGLVHHPAVAQVVVVAQRDLPDFRRRQGWSLNEGGVDYGVVVDPDRETIRKLAAGADEKVVHLFAGVRWVPCIVAGLREVLASGRPFGILSEPRVREGAWGWLRYLHSRLGEGRLRRHADFVLAIGRHGPSWFEGVGYPRERIFPFAYFLPPPPGLPLPGVREAVRVCFAGRLERSKGLHHFLDAMPQVRHPASFHIAGRGRLQRACERAAERDPRLRFHGVVPMVEMAAFMQSCDILVLPSLTSDDGWGAVVSEALLAGTAVVASERAGASICLDGDWRGRVVAAGSAAAIAAAIDGLIEGRRLDGDWRDRRASWAGERLTGAAGADYLVRILRSIYEGGARPAPFHSDSA